MHTQTLSWLCEVGAEGAGRTDDTLREGRHQNEKIFANFNHNYLLDQHGNDKKL